MSFHSRYAFRITFIKNNNLINQIRRIYWPLEINTLGTVKTYNYLYIKNAKKNTNALEKKIEGLFKKIYNEQSKMKIQVDSRRKRAVV